LLAERKKEDGWLFSKGWSTFWGWIFSFLHLLALLSHGNLTKYKLVYILVYFLGDGERIISHSLLYSLFSPFAAWIFFLF